ncbi:hypothetical protein I4U23_005448 [Adineta vaga]|nr:hypothetical protein I4U23_005448 [Adineta vaga]
MLRTTPTGIGVVFENIEFIGKDKISRKKLKTPNPDSLKFAQKAFQLNWPNRLREEEGKNSFRHPTRLRAVFSFPYNLRKISFFVGYRKPDPVLSFTA